jgi:Tfp pilus assembly protein PilO
MSESVHGMPLVRRMVQEHRRALLAIAALIVANLVVYATVVYPLGQRVANSEQRDRAADNALAAARADQAQASGTLTGKARASTELATFYKDVLPANLAGARRLTHLRLPQMAREANLRFDRSSYAPVDERSSTLHRLKIEMNLGGSYDAIRRFIHQLETSPEFVVIDNISLSEDTGDSGQLTVNLQLSTYYRDEAGR